MNIKKFPVPATRDPFVNTPLINAGFDPETHEERFWISTWNENVGCLGALVTPNGKSRIYRIKRVRDLIGCGAYSACLTDNDTIWMISDLQAFCRLSLSTGEYEFFETGADKALVFAGMQYDKETGKLMAMAFADTRMCAVSFDVNEKKTAKLYDGFTKATSFSGGFPNGDGTYSFCLNCEHDAFYRWNPKKETLEELCKSKPISKEYFKLIQDSSGRIYAPYVGWVNSDCTFSQKNMPKLEMAWFGRLGNTAYGYTGTPEGIDVYTWDIPSGKTEKLFSAPDGGACAMTRDGEILDVTLYGELLKFSRSGELLMKKTLDSNAQGRVDCLIRAAKSTLLGTPFITQRFWTLDTETGAACDIGRAAPGCGEVLRTWHIGGKVYMASYTKGILTEYDPKKPGAFPENPRIVAKAPNGMRPVADERRDNVLYYACTHHYGALGCVLTRYDTEIGSAVYNDDPIANQHIISLCFDSSKSILLGGTTYKSDCNVTYPKDDVCYIVELNPDTLEITYKLQAPHGCDYVNVVGAADDENILVVFSMRNAASELWLYNTVNKSTASLGITLEEYNAGKLRYTGNTEIYFSGKTGEFVINGAGKALLVALTDGKLRIKREIFDNPEIYAIFLDGQDVYGVTEQEIYIAEGALS